MKKAVLLCFLGFFSPSYGQEKSEDISFWEPAGEKHPVRFNTVLYGHVGGATAALVGLNELWYSDYPRSSFHLINDNADWLQMDKAGHTMTAYHLGLMSIDMFEWSGVERRKAVWYGGLSGLIFLGSVEVLDGFSDQWGFSTGDFAANTLGAAIVVAQELGWGEQRISLKYSYSPSPYRNLRPEILGSTGLEAALKDYNGQTYWISMNMRSLSGCEFLPSWLNLAAGYSGAGMISGNAGDGIQRRSGEIRHRQFFLSLDLDLRRVDTGSAFWNTVLRAVNFVKIPFPALEWNKVHGMRGRGIYF